MSLSASSSGRAPSSAKADRLPNYLFVAIASVALLLAGCDFDAPTSRDMSLPTAVSVRGREASFEDVTEATGLNFRHFLGDVGEYRYPEIMAGGVGLLDYDRDGDLDVFFTQGTITADTATPEDFGEGGRLYRNELTPAGTLSFIDVTAQAGIVTKGYGMGVTVGDIDNDGYPDLYVTSYDRAQLFHNQGDGTFSDVATRSGVGSLRWSTSATFVDYDLDGDLDLFVAHYVNSMWTNHETCLGPLGELDYCGPWSYESVPDRLYRNDGKEQFKDVTEAAGLGAASGPGLGVVAADFNDDGWPDIYVANDGQANHLWMNRGDGTFADEALLAGAAYNEGGEPEAGMGIAVGDVDRDGDDDLLVTHLIDETNTLYLNDGEALFQDATRVFGITFSSLGLTGFGVVLFDYDRDGWLDLYVANGAVAALPGVEDPFPYAQRDLLLHNEEGRFRDVTAEAGPALKERRVGRGVAAGDIDNDGDVDLLVANINGLPQLLINNSEARGKWLRLKLVGKASNRDAIGARVGISLSGGAIHWSTVRRDGSYLASNDPRVHVGVPTNQSVERIEVRWPSGSRETWSRPESNVELVLEEGSGTLVVALPGLETQTH
tara:strand:+ start:426 stop:2240 length:1815 start_codon:yes stop_codon:yes gene_type:complete